MKNYLLFVVIFFCAIQMFYSQEDGVVSLALPVRNSLTFNQYVINPTFSFVREQDRYITLYNKREWVQFEDAPQTYLASYSGRFRENIGVGVGLFQQNYGVLTTFGGILNFAYNARLDKDSNLTFGLNVGAYKSGLNSGSVTTNFPDPSLDNIPSNFLLTVNPGINYGTAFFDVGVSVNNLVLYNINSSELIEDNPQQSIQGHLMYTGYMDSYGFFDESKFSGLVRSEFGKSETIVSGILMLTVPKGIWAQVGYNTLYGASGGLGLNITPQLAIEYNFEKAMGDLTDFGPSHDITLAYRFNSRENYDYGEEDELGSIISLDKKRKPVSKVAKLDAAKRAQMAADAKIEAEAKAQAKADAEAKAKADAEVKAIAAEEAKAKAKADVEARLKADREAQAKAEAQAQAKIAQDAIAAQEKIEAEKLAKDVAEAKAKLAREAKAKADAQAKFDEENRIKAEAQAKLDAEKLATELAAAKAKAELEAKAKAELEAKDKAEAQAKLDEENRIREAQEAKEQADAQAKLEAEKLAKEAAAAQAKADTEAQALIDAQLAAEAQAKEEAQAKLDAEAQTAKENEEPAVGPTDTIAKEMKNLTELTDDSQAEQTQLLTQLSEAIANKDKDLKDLKEENDLGEQGIFMEPKPFKSVTAENNAIEALKGDLDAVIASRNERIKELEELYDERVRIATMENDTVNLYYQRTIKKLKAEQLTALATKTQLESTLEDIQVATEFERKRRIKRALYNNEEDRYELDKATLNVIKQNTPLSKVPLTPKDFDFGEEQSSNIQIFKNVKNVENGYYMIVAVHSDVEKRDDFLTKTVASGQTNIDFFYDVNTSKYYIYYQKFDSIEDANRAIQSKGSRPYNTQMSIVKIENQ